MEIHNFKVLNLKLKDNDIFQEIDVNFYDKSDQPNEPYTTLVIGPNGTGKSNLLRLIILLFIELKEFKRTKRRSHRVQGKFFLKYLIDGQVITYYNYDFDAGKDVKPQIMSNGRPIEFDAILTPERIIATAVMLTDKFPVEISGVVDYTYLGVKSNYYMAKTTSFVNKTIDLLFESLESEEAKSNIQKALNFLGYDNQLFIYYSPRYKHIFLRGILRNTPLKDFLPTFGNTPKELPIVPLGVIVDLSLLRRKILK